MTLHQQTRKHSPKATTVLSGRDPDRSIWSDRPWCGGSRGLGRHCGRRTEPILVLKLRVSASPWLA
jgi:hypothetical protein